MQIAVAMAELILSDLLSAHQSQNFLLLDYGQLQKSGRDFQTQRQNVWRGLINARFACKCLFEILYNDQYFHLCWWRTYIRIVIYLFIYYFSISIISIIILTIAFIIVQTSNTKLFELRIGWWKSFSLSRFSKRKY